MLDYLEFNAAAILICYTVCELLSTFLCPINVVCSGQSKRFLEIKDHFCSLNAPLKLADGLKSSVELVKAINVFSCCAQALANNHQY